MKKLILSIEQVRKGLILLVLFIVIRAMLAYITGTNLLATSDANSALFLLSAFLILSVGVVYLGFSRWVGVNLNDWWGFDRSRLPGDIGWGLLGFILLFVASAAVMIPVAILGLVPTDVTSVPGIQTSTSSFALMLFFGFAIAGFQEETIFRGFLQGVLSERLSAWPGNFLQAAIFSIAHIGYYPLDAWPLFVLAFISGIIFGWLRMKRQSLVSPWIAHGLFG